MAVGVFKTILRWGMAEQQQRQCLRTLRNNRDLARFVVEGRATGKQLGTLLDKGVLKYHEKLSTREPSFIS